jgi:NCAIR mutase (PurE)-related protein
MCVNLLRKTMVMSPQEIEQLARSLLAGTMPLEEFFVALLSQLPQAELGDATLDLDRGRRCGFPEVVFGAGKSVPMLERIFRRLLDEGIPVLATRIDAEKAAELQMRFPQAAYNAAARTLRIAAAGQVAAHPERLGKVAVITAGSSDLPVAEEARETLDWMGVAVTMIHDVGVAGPHRLPAQTHKLRGLDAAVVVAGMEGALPSVVGGHVDCPVIAVPTSIGYGASFQGVAALLGMLNSCAANVTVVNIDAGFKGGYVAGLIARRRHLPPEATTATGGDSA